MTSIAYKIPSKLDDHYPYELENISKKERHGLFSQPPPLTVDDKFDDALKSQGNERPILTNPRLKKNHEPSLFQDPAYISINDPYKESFKQKQIYEKEKVMAISHAYPFRPTDASKKIITSEFEHMKEYNDKQFDRRTSAGKVRSESRNFLNNPGKRGFGNTTIGHLFSNNKYVSDPYDRLEEQDRKERILHRSKFLHQNKGFCSTNHGNRPFTADLKVFDGAGYKPYSSVRNYYQTQAFRPSNPNKRGHNGFFEKLDYMEEGGPVPKSKQTMSQKIAMTQTFDKPWRPNSNGTFHRPQPSIVSTLKRARSSKSRSRGI